MYVPPWMQRPPAPPQRKRPVLRANPAVADMLGSEFADRPLGGKTGEFLGDPAQPPPQPGPPLRIDPPPWADELAAGAHVEPPKPPPRPDPVAELKRLSGEEEQWPEWGPPAPPPKPLERPTFPKPDWEAEEKQRIEHEQRLQRERRAALVEEWLAEDDQTYPAKPRKGAA